MATTTPTNVASHEPNSLQDLDHETTLQGVDTLNLHPAERIATAQSQNALHLTLSQQTTISLPDMMLPATAGNQIPAEERAKILAERRRQAAEEAERPKPKGFARLFAAFKHPKTRAGNTFGRWSVSYGGAGQIQGDRGVYGGLM